MARASSALFILPKAPTAAGRSITEYPTADPREASRLGIVTGPDGNHLVHWRRVGKIARMALPGQITEFPLPPEDAIADFDRRRCRREALVH